MHLGSTLEEFIGQNKKRKDKEIRAEMRGM